MVRIRFNGKGSIFQYFKMSLVTDDVLHSQGVFGLGTLTTGRPNGRSATPIESL